MDDDEDFSDDLKEEPEVKYEWEYVHCNWIQVPVYKERSE